MGDGPPLPREELVRLRRLVGLPDVLPHEDPDAPVPEGSPRCGCGCGSWVRRSPRGGRAARYVPGHEPRSGVHRRRP